MQYGRGRAYTAEFEKDMSSLQSGECGPKKVGVEKSKSARNVLYDTTVESSLCGARGLLSGLTSRSHNTLGTYRTRKVPESARRAYKTARAFKHEIFLCDCRCDGGKEELGGGELENMNYLM